jgi:hypothetical protein
MKNNFEKFKVTSQLFFYMFITICLFSCASHFKKMPRPDETIKEDIPLVCYHTWVEFEVSPEAAHSYFQDANNLGNAFDWLNFELKDQDTGRLDVPGDGVHFHTTIAGVPFSGRIVLTFSELGKRVEAFHVMGVWVRHSWVLEKLEEDSCNMQLRVYTELPDIPFIYKIISPQLVGREAGKRIDYSVDRMKADLEGLPLPQNFPGTIRGKVFSSTVRIYRTAIKIERAPDQVYKYITRLDNFNRASEMLHFEPFNPSGVLRNVGQRCYVSSLHSAPFELSGTSLIVESVENDRIHHLIYFEKSLAGFMVKLRRKGINKTLLEYSFYYHIPDYTSEDIVTTLHAVSQLDEALRLALQNIKSEMESIH